MECYNAKRVKFCLCTNPLHIKNHKNELGRSLNMMSLAFFFFFSFSFLSIIKEPAFGSPFLHFLSGLCNPILSLYRHQWSLECWSRPLSLPRSALFATPTWMDLGSDGPATRPLRRGSIQSKVPSRFHPGTS